MKIKFEELVSSNNSLLSNAEISEIEDAMRDLSDPELRGISGGGHYPKGHYPGYGKGDDDDGGYGYGKGDDDD